MLICTPDKDLAQCVQGARVVQLNRRTKAVLDELAVFAKYGVLPASVPDYLALVGDNADGYPGLPGWGAKPTSAITRPSYRDKWWMGSRRPLPSSQNPGQHECGAP